MRKIEKMIVEAVKNNKNIKIGNSEVHEGAVYLHGSRIAFNKNGKLIRDEETFKRWPTNVTKSRLRALGVM